MSNYSELVAKVSGPADLAVVLLAGTAGLVVDAGLNIFGFLSPGTTMFAAAGTALGLKKSLEASLVPRQQRRDEKAVVARAQALAHELSNAGLSKQQQELNRELRLFEMGVIDANQLATQVDRAVSIYRDVARAFSLPPVDEG